MTRLTIVFRQGTYVHNVENLSNKAGSKETKILNSYDVVAVRPLDQENVFERAFTKSDADIISLDLSVRHRFYIKKTWVKEAMARGISIEIVYGSGCLE